MNRALLIFSLFDQVSVPSMVKEVCWAYQSNDETALWHYGKSAAFVTAGSETDWHYDPSGSSTWLYVAHGRKMFLLAHPEPKTLEEHARNKFRGLPKG